MTSCRFQVGPTKLQEANIARIIMKVLNRDLWSNAGGVKAIVGEHFVFWQQYKVKWQSVEFSQEQIEKEFGDKNSL